MPIVTSTTSPPGIMTRILAGLFSEIRGVDLSKLSFFSFIKGEQTNEVRYRFHLYRLFIWSGCVSVAHS